MSIAHTRLDAATRRHVARPLTSAFGLGLCLACATAVASAQPPAARTGGVNRATRPTPTAPKAPTLPAVVTRTLRNGITVAVLENHEIPVVRVRAVVDVPGSLVDPAGKEGLASIVGAMLSEGTKTRTADQMAEAFADLGNVVTPGGFLTTTANVDRSLALLADLLLEPAFPEPALQRVKANRAATLRRQKDQPGYIAGRVFANALYGAGHPYERAASEQSVQAIGRDDLAQFHADYYRPQNVKFVVAGAISPDAAVAKLERAFGGWATGGKSARGTTPPAPRGSGATRVLLFDRPGSAQSVLYVGQLGPQRSVPDFYAIDLLNTAYGGAFNSRLNLSLRERYHFTYGAGSQFAFRRRGEPGTFVASSQVATAKTDSALVELMRELRDFREGRPMTEEELTFAKASATKSLGGRFETVSQLAAGAEEILVNDLPLDYYGQLAGNIGRVTLAEARAAASRYLDPANMAIVVVGDRKAIEPGLRAANIAPVVVVDEQARPIEGGP